MRAVLWIVLIGAFTGFTCTFLLESSYTSRAEKFQAVRIDPKQHSPFGPVTIDIGEPRLLILESTSGILKNKTGTGIRMLDIDEAKARGNIPIELQTISRVVSLARLGCVLSLFVASAGLILLGKMNSQLLSLEP